MIGKLIQGILGKQVSAPPAPVQRRTNQSKPKDFPFWFLDERLRKQVLRYLETGEGPDTLKRVEDWRSQRSSVSGSLFETNALVWRFAGNPEGLVRYAKLRSVLNVGVRSNMRDTYMDSIPPEVLDLLKHLTWSRGIEDATRFADASKAVELLGGTDADLLLFMLPLRRYTNGYQIGFPHKGEVVFSAESVQDTLSRLETKELILGLSFLHRTGGLKDPGLLAYLFERLAGSSGKLRDIVQEALLAHPDRDRVEQMSIDNLPAGSAAKRAALVKVLGHLQTPKATAALEAHRAVEKTQSVLTTIDMFITGEPDTEEAEGGYIDVSGARVEIPVRDLPEDDGSEPLDEGFAQKVRELEDRDFEDRMERYRMQLEHWEKAIKKYKQPEPPRKRGLADEWMKTLNNPVTTKDRVHIYFGYSIRNGAEGLLNSAIEKLPLRRVVDLACAQNSGRVSSVLSHYHPFSAAVRNAMRDGRIYLSQTLRIAHGFQRAEDDFDPLDWYLRSALASRGASIEPGIWELAASRLDLLVEALPPFTNDVATNLRALKILEDFPSLPQAVLQAVLFAASDPREKLHSKAQAMLRDVEGIDAHLITLLDDKRQGMRANTARFLAERAAKEALPALKKRLKREKSEIAKAEMIGAVARLGGDTSPYLGKAALMKEAEAQVAKLPNAKMDFLDLKKAPRLYWKDGKAADPVIADAWLRLALKLKSPKGTPLFHLYLEQMTPESAAAFCDWVLDSWTGYDTYRPAGDAVHAEAARRAKLILAQQNHWMTYTGMTEDEIIRHISANMTSTFVNSGAESKGILAMSHKATPATAGPKIAAYLKQHGHRVSQAKALVETLFGMGSSDAVQVLVATATRFKQRTVRELAGELVTELANARGWTEDELADRSVATGGFDETGIIPLPIGDEGKDYMARLGDDLSVLLINPAGKVVKSLPAGKDANTKESKALLSAAKKTVKTVTQQQTSRLYEAMLTPRVWDKTAWIDDLTTHPIMRRLIERLVWRGLDADGAYVQSFRLTSEGEYMNAEGDDVDLGAFEKIDLAHTANLPEDEGSPWLQHFKDFEVKGLFPQLSRPVRTLDPDRAEATQIEDREGWLTSAFKLRSAAKKAGYDRGPVVDSGGYFSYRKDFRGAGLTAELKFTGGYAGGEEDIPVAIEYMKFYAMPAPTYEGTGVALNKVPPLLLSEVWNDLHEIAKIGAYEEDWKSKSYY